MIRFFTLPLQTFIRRETLRFMAVAMQTVVAPAVTNLMFFAVFILALGQNDRVIAGLPYAVFLAPGLVMMSMAQNAFANTSSSIIIAKVQGTMADILMAPLTAGQILTGYVTGGVIRGLMVGAVCLVTLLPMAAMSFHNPALIIVYGVLGSLLMAVLGVLGGLWSDKFDHMAAVTNFVITPLTFLSGTFYDIQSLPENWQFLAHLNPVFYMIDGFRYALTGTGESPVATRIAALGVGNAALLALTWVLMRKGYKIRQ